MFVALSNICPPAQADSDSLINREANPLADPEGGGCRVMGGC